MPKKLTILGALTAALVFGYLGLFSSSASGVPIQQFATSGLAEISVDQCYDTNAANYPTISAGRVVCNAANPDPATTGLATATNYTSWQIINLPIGNRLTLPAGFTPSGAGQWSNTAIGCAPLDANNRCTAGTTVGNITSRTDIFCNQQIDILASGGPGGAPGLWPDSSLWTPPTFTRIAAAGALGGGDELGSADPDSYIHGAVSMPASVWDFRSSDLSNLTTLYIDGTLGFPIPGGSKLNNVVYQSTYPGQTGLNVNQALLGGSPDNPPSDDVSLCLSSPQDSVSQVGYLVSPAAGTIIPRWTILQSDFDLGDHSLARILDWQCDRFNPAPADADGDCDPDTTDSNDGNKDIDGDLVPDGVERAYNSDPTDADTDNDGATDYEEIFQFTDPQDADTDGDGQADKQDSIATNGANVPAGNNLSAAALNPELLYDSADATDDNCPNESNASQLNTDSLWQYHGMGGNADPDGAGPLLGQNTSTGDRTNPNEDVQGDACDTDDDNDAIPDLTEPLLRIAPWSGPTDPGGADAPKSSVCVGVAYAGGTAPIRAMSSVLGDVDFDMVLDGRECQFRSRPDASCRVVAVDAGCVGGGATAEAKNCSSGSVAAPFALGCAQPAANATTPGGGDTDSDSLYMPGTAASHEAVEIFFRTKDINIATGVQVDDIDGDLAQGDADADSDRDTVGASGTFAGLRDGIEVRFYNSNPATADSDSDGCRDGDEVADMNGDGNQNPADSGLRQQATGSHDTAPANGRMDTNVTNAQGVSRYAIATNRDLTKDAQNNPADAGVLAAAIAAAGTCSPYNETGVTSSSATKGLP